MDLFSYYGSCNERGTVLPPKEVEEGERFSVIIKKNLDKALKGFALTGYFQLGYAILINLPWIVFVTVISRNIEFK